MPNACFTMQTPYRSKSDKLFLPTPKKKETIVQFSRGDLFGGLTAGVVALPLALAFGVASGAGAQAGLYGAAILGFFAALLGGTPTQISGPTGPMTVVFAAALTSLGGNLDAAMMVVLLGGLGQIALGAIKAGSLIRYVPYPVISGFMSGVGVIIILLQTGPFVGAPSWKSPLEAITHLPLLLERFNGAAFALAAATLALVFLMPKRIARLVPPPLTALVVLTVLSVALDLDVPRIGAIPEGLPQFHMPTFVTGYERQILLLGVTMALLGTIDSLLTSLVADSLTRTRHQPNKELFGQGVGNAVCAFFGGLPGAGATMRTVINIKAGAQTRLSGIVHSLFLFALLLGLGPLAAYVPLSVLAGILIKVGIDILDYRFLKVAKYAPRDELLVALAVFLLTVFVDLIMAVGVGIVMALILTIRRLKEMAAIEITPGTIEGEVEGNFRRLVAKGPLFFGPVVELMNKVDQIFDFRGVLFDLREVTFFDLTALFLIEEMAEQAVGEGLRVAVLVTPEQAEKIAGMKLPGLDSSRLFTDPLQAELMLRAPNGEAA